MKSNKLKKILTSKITVGVVCFILGGMVLGDEVEQPMQQVSSSGQTQKENASEDDKKSESTSKSDSKLTQIKLGEPYVIKSSDGDYNVTVEKIRFTDERNEFSEKEAKHVIFLDFNYENISNKEEVYLSESNFKVMDEDGNVLDTYPVSDDSRNSKSLPVGGKCKASAAYAMPKSSKTLKVLFYDNMFGNAIGETTVDTGL